jgi:predicted kinase
VATFVLSGPPCAGKSTLAWSLAQPGDVVLDFDRICCEFGSPAHHAHPVKIRERAEREMQRRMWRLQFHAGGDAYVIRWAPRAADRVALAKRLDATVWLINPGFEECARRAGLDDRPADTLDAIRKWFRLYRPSSVDRPCPHAADRAPTVVTSRDW